MEKVISIIWPIKKEELSKFVPMALILFLTIFNYNSLKAIKDSLVVPAVGAEALNFIKVYFVVPGAVLFVLLYMRLANRFFLRQIYLGIGIFYMIYFLLFAFVLYPYQDYIHPNPEAVHRLIHEKFHIFGYAVAFDHFKWFFLLYNKWLYVIFYVLAELWGSSMTFLLFWQFSNQIVPTDQSKRFYPMLNLFGSSGTFMAGILIQYLVIGQLNRVDDGKALFVIQNMLTVLTISAFLILIVVLYIYRNLLNNQDLKKPNVPFKDIKKKLPFKESLRLVLSSRYLGYIVIMVLAYGISINLLEGPWKAKVKELYPTTASYVQFMGVINQWNGALAIIFSLIGVLILKKYSWFAAAIVTPVMIFVTGVAFFSFVVFDNVASVVLDNFTLVSPLVMAVVLGGIQNVLSKSSKYGLFDSTKEMTYIPIDEELKSKGKAAVDVIGARAAKSGGAFIQSLLFMLFPAATYTTISPILMVILIIICIIWILDVNLLNKAYLKFVNKNTD
ncbi:MAG: NTP/NDP exchange transporter [Rickettsiales bacterium]|nr:NTP/NDP exchange transporter [Rickettsiales bacterium]